MHPTRLLAALTLIGFGAGPTTITRADESVPPLVSKLLQEQAQGDRRHESPFFVALRDLAKQHDVVTEQYIPDDFLDEGYAERLSADRVILILRGKQNGENRQHTLLLDGHGKVLDRFSFAVRLRTFGAPKDAGPFFTDVYPTPKPDGASVVVTFGVAAGDDRKDHPLHSLTYRGRQYRLPIHGGEIPGLCRFAIRDDQFEIVFPRLVIKVTQ